VTARDLFTDTPREEAESVGNGSALSGRGAADHRQSLPTATAGFEPRARARICGECGNGTPNRHEMIICGEGKPWEWLRADAACQFEPVRWVPITNSKQARRDAQAGIDQAVAAADRQIEGWSDLAYAFIELFCTRNKGRRCIGHEIVQASVEYGVIQPANAKAWGAPIQRAARSGLLKRVGYGEDPNRHGNPVPLWEVAA